MVSEDPSVTITRHELNSYEENEDQTVSAKRVIVQDQTSENIDLYACKVLGTTTPTSAISVDEKSVVVASATGAATGKCINIREGSSYFQSLISGVNGTTISFASPCDKPFTTAAQVCFGEWNLALSNGSTTPEIFFVCPPPLASYDIYGISISMEDDTVMYESKFGGINQLTNGFVGRQANGTKKNLFLVSNNAGFREYGFITEYPDKVPSGTYAFWADKHFTEDNGVAIRIHGSESDQIQFINSDNLTGLTKLAITIHAHKVI